MVMVASNHAAVDCDTVLCHMITENVNKTLNKVELNGLFFSFCIAKIMVWAQGCDVS